MTHPCTNRTLTIGKAATIAAVVGVMALATEANVEGGVSQGEIVIRLKAGNVVNLSVAKSEAALILSNVGVRVQWERRDYISRPAAGSVRCARLTADISVIDLDILDSTSAENHPGALGYSLPFQRSGVRIVVFSDRVLAMRSGPNLLGHVIAHEVGHILMGTLAHAESGVMRAHWNAGDLAAIGYGSLAFTPVEAEMIAQNLDWQRKGCAANRIPVESEAVIR
jgi:Zn-dependent protease with chaperone function